MRRVFSFPVTVLVLLAFTGVASASPPGENTNTVTITIDCGDFGTFTGSLLGGTGGALVLEDQGGVAVAQGIATADGQVIQRPTPGLEMQGTLVECRYTAGSGRQFVVNVLFAPASP
jgi:hypothetical protein